MELVEYDSFNYSIGYLDVTVTISIRYYIAYEDEQGNKKHEVEHEIISVENEKLGELLPKLNQKTIDRLYKLIN